MFSLNLNPWLAVKRQQEEFDDAIVALEATIENLHAANQRMREEREAWRAKYNRIAVDFDLFVSAVEKELSLARDRYPNGITPGTEADCSDSHTRRQSMPYKGD